MIANKKSLNSSRAWVLILNENTDENHTYFGSHIKTTRGFNLSSHWTSRFIDQNKTNWTQKHYFSLITVRRALPWPPNKLFYNLVNQDTQIWLTVTPPCRVQQASDVTTNYWKHVVLYFMNKEEDICWRTQQLCTHVTLLLGYIYLYIYPQLRK